MLAPHEARGVHAQAANRQQGTREGGPAGARGRRLARQSAQAQGSGARAGGSGRSAEAGVSNVRSAAETQDLRRVHGVGDATGPAPCAGCLGPCTATREVCRVPIVWARRTG